MSISMSKLAPTPLSKIKLYVSSTTVANLIHEILRITDTVTPRQQMLTAVASVTNRQQELE